MVLSIKFISSILVYLLLEFDHDNYFELADKDCLMQRKLHDLEVLDKPDIVGFPFFFRGGGTCNN